MKYKPGKHSTRETKIHMVISSWRVVRHSQRSGGKLWAPEALLLAVDRIQDKSISPSIVLEGASRLRV